MNYIDRNIQRKTDDKQETDKEKEKDKK